MKFLDSVKAKVAIDMFTIQMGWSLWFIPIVLVVNILVNQFVPEVQERGLSFIAFIFQPAKIYMLVIGIISGFAFLSHFIKNGIIRKDYFSGSAIAAAGVALGIIVISAVITVVMMLFDWFAASPPSNIDFLEATSSAWLVPILALSLITFSYYIAGWIIAVGFQRFGGWGIGFVGIAIVQTILTDILWEGHPTHPLTGFIRITLPDLSIPTALAGTTLIIGLGLWLLRATTRRMPITPE
ncbi:MAG: hypothetical protein FH749_14855 [Firmicutes bacterium]|nr:hypothetical protein [Bacillota bacterium]